MSRIMRFCLIAFQICGCGFSFSGIYYHLPSWQRYVRYAEGETGTARTSVLFGMASASAVHAAMVPFTFAITGGSALTGPPSPATPTVGVMLFASGSFAPFGSATYTEEGSI